MSIKDLQRRQTEVGRLRVGYSVETGKKDKHGQPIRRAIKLETFRFSSPSRKLIEQVAEMYGGDPAEWEPQGGGAKVWEVYTKADSLPVVVPPNSVSQWYESWLGGACMRRCDGERELLKDQPCQCSPESAARQCKPTTRISLMLAEVPGIGVWRLESHGYYAATELPAVAELLAAAGGYVPARLELEERSARRPKADGTGMETRRWMVPVLHVDAAPAQLLALTGSGRAELEGASRPAIAAQPAAQTDPLEVASYKAEIESKTTVEDLRALWRHIGETATLTKEQTAELTQTFWARKKAIEDHKPDPAGVDYAAVQEAEPDVNEVWGQILHHAESLGWNTPMASKAFREQMGRDVADADGWAMAQFLDWLKGGALA